MPLRAITCPVILNSVSTRVDGSLTLRFSTPELDSDAKLAFLELQNKELRILIQPDGEQLEAIKEVKSELSQKTPGQRLRACLFIAYTQNGKLGDFEDYYRTAMERIIETVKSKLQ